MKDDEYEVVVVRHGTRTGLRSEAYLNYQLYGRADGEITTDYYLWVARNERRTVLIDTGFDAAAAARRGRQVLLSPAEVYRALGIDTSLPHPLIVTHAHWDHIGNLRLFPRSPVWIARSEFEFWSSALSQKPLLGHFAESAEIARLRELRGSGRLRLFDDVASPAPGIAIECVGGHTPGQSMVSITTPGGIVLLTSDVVHFVEELEQEIPFVSVTDLPAMYTGFERVKKLVATGAVDTVVTGHDPGEIERLIPLGGILAGNAGTVPRTDQNKKRDS